MPLPPDVLSFLKSHTPSDDDLPNDSCVLSVYVDNSESHPGKRQAWREWLRGRVRAERQRLANESPMCLVAFERSLTVLEARLPDLHAEVRAEYANVPGWMVCCSADGDAIEARLSTTPAAMCVWSPAAMLMPYLDASLPAETVIVLIDRAHATVGRIQRGVVHVVDAIVADDTGDAHEQLLATTRRKLAVIAGHEVRVVVGGAVPSVAQFVSQLPDDLRLRTAVADSLHLHTPFTLMPPLAHAALRPIETRRQLSLVSSFARRAHLTRRGAFTLESVQQASRAGAIERALISPHLWERDPLAVERVAQRALRAGATIEVATPECAAVLDEAGGIAAELRFAVDGVAPPSLANV